jgi:hypothetical protein
MHRLTRPLLIGLLACSGCSLLSGIIKGRHDDKLRELEAKGDYEGLATTCAQPGHSAACDAKRRVGMKRLDASGCETLVADVRRYYSSSDATKAGDVVLVQKLAACKQLAPLIDGELYLNSLPEALAEAEAKGTEVFAPFIAFLAESSAAFSGEGGTHQATRIAKWLIAVGDAERCTAIDSHIEHVADESRGEFLWVYYELGCGAQALPHAERGLVADEAGRRIQACDVIGKFGDAALLGKLETLAETDPFKAEREIRAPSGAMAIEVYYPVRERCMAASGKLRLRG